MNNKLENIKKILTEKNLKLSVGESCTGGLISSLLTDLDGASKFIEINFVTYSEFAKVRFLYTPKHIIDKFGVVSTETAHYMALGLLNYAGVSIATTGYLGPTGGDDNNPIGTVHFAFGYKNTVVEHKYISDKKSRVEIKHDIANHVLIEFEKFLVEMFT